jgi:putative permease
MNQARSLVLNRWLAFSALAILILLFIFVPGVVKMVVVSVLLAYIFDPIVTAIELRGLSRTASTLVFFFFVILIAWGLFAALAPVVYNQIMALRSGAGSQQTSQVILKLQAVVRDKLGFIGLGDVNLEEKISQLTGYLSDTILDFILHEGLSLILYAVTIPFLVFFFLKDGREMKKHFIGIVPNRYFEFALDLLYKMDVQLGNYLRSQFTDAVVFGVLATTALWLLGVKYFLFIGPFAGLANLIPYVGPIAGALPAVAVALFDKGDITLGFQIILAFIILKLTDDMLVQPLLVAKGVHMHPLLVLLAIIIGGELFGMLGMLLAVPATGFVKVVLQESIVTLKKYRFTD